jgi:hypothetical protein
MEETRDGTPTNFWPFCKGSDNAELKMKKGRFLNDFEEPPRLLVLEKPRDLPFFRFSTRHYPQYVLAEN